MYYTQEQINRANQADLVSFLQSQGEQLTRAGNEYRWKRHDSLTVRGNKWYRHSQSKGGAPNATKTEQAERLILDLLADGKELASEDIVKAAAEAGISERTVQNAKRNMGGILGARRVGGQWYNFIKKKQPPEPAS